MRHVFEQFGAEMLRGADAGMAVGKLAGLRPGERHQFRHRPDRLLGRNGEHVGRDEHLRDRCEIPQRIERQGFIQARIDHQRRVAAHQQQVAVGGRLGDAIGGDVAAGAGNVLDHERRAPGFRKPVGENARRKIGSRAGGEANQDLHRPVRIAGLRRCRLRREQHKKRGEQVRGQLHGFLRGRVCRSLSPDLRQVCHRCAGPSRRIRRALRGPWRAQNQNRENNPMQSRPASA